MHWTLPRSQPLALGERGHHLEAVAQDQAIGPVTLVAVEVGLVRFLRDPVEIGEEVELIAGLAVARLVAIVPGRPTLGPAPQVVDQRLGMHLLLDVERRGVHHQIGPVLLILAAPDELRVQVAIALRLLLGQRISARLLTV